MGVSNSSRLLGFICKLTIWRGRRCLGLAVLGGQEVHNQGLLVHGTGVVVGMVALHVVGSVSVHVWYASCDSKLAYLEDINEGS